MHSQVYYDHLNQTVVSTTSMILIMLGVYSFLSFSDYRADFFLLMGLLWFVYAIRHYINLNPLHFFMFSIFLIAHNLGVFNFYSEQFFGIEYDYYVHVYFGIVIACMIFNALKGTGLTAYQRFITAIFAMLVISIGHEMFEYISGLVWGTGDGALLHGAGDGSSSDSIVDVINNYTGLAIGTLAYVLGSIVSRWKTAEQNLDHAAIHQSYIEEFTS